MKFYLGIGLYFVFIGFVFANNEAVSLLGEWHCLQEGEVTDDVKGTNLFKLKYSTGEKEVEQIGQVIIADSTKQKASILDYSILFDSIRKNMSISSTLRTLNYEVVQDELNMFNENISNFFPKMGHEINARFTHLENNYLRSISEDGSIIECNRKLLK
jgi:hypothetical protein